MVGDHVFGGLDEPALLTLGGSRHELLVMAKGQVKDFSPEILGILPVDFTGRDHGKDDFSVGLNETADEILELFLRRDGRHGSSWHNRDEVSRARQVSKPVPSRLNREYVSLCETNNRKEIAGQRVWVRVQCGGSVPTSCETDLCPSAAIDVYESPARWGLHVNNRKKCSVDHPIHGAFA